MKAFLAALIALQCFPLSSAAMELRQMQTPRGTHHGIWGDKPTKPAPTLFIIGNPISVMGQESMRHLLGTGNALAKQGWIYVVLDPACEGHDLKQGQPSSLAGWAIRAKKGEDFLGPYLRNCIDVLDHLIAEGFTDAQRVAVQGVSRGGFCALHFAARDPRIKVVVGVSPVTNPLALKEFAGVTAQTFYDNHVRTLFFCQYAQSAKAAFMAANYTRLIALFQHQAHVLKRLGTGRYDYYFHCIKILVKC